MPSEDLHPLLVDIRESIAAIRKEVVKLIGEVQKIPEAIQEATETIRDAIQENIQAQAELKLMEHVMDARSIKPQIEAEQEQVQSEREDLDNRLENINKRYEEKHEELNQKARDRIRNLGSHIFQIDEEEFELGIETPFTEQVTMAWQQLQEHNTDVEERRKTTVQETVGETVQSIHDYIDSQDHLIDKIDTHRFDAKETALPTDRDEPLQVPYYIVEYQVDGQAHQEVVLPSYLSENDGMWFTAGLESIAGSESVIGEPSDIGQEGDQEMLASNTITTNLDEHQGTSKSGVSFSGAVKATIPENGSVPVTTERRSE